MVALLDLLNERGALSLSFLATSLGASAATIRRDVAQLAAQGLLERTHGGCRPLQGSTELPVRLRDAKQADAKKAIAQRIAREIPPGKHMLALTGGSTVAAVLRSLEHRTDLTIITNSISIGLAAAEQGQSRVLIAGGVLRPSSLELVGALTEETMKLVNVGTAIVGVSGCSVEAGFTGHDETEARTNLLMLEHAQRVIVVMDSTKLGQSAKAKIVGLDKVDLLVTDDRADPERLEKLRRAGLQVAVVKV
ncbi:DeoR/GlpR family DNA-binding transcription regulator [Tessaracoccus sp. OH4464_COT-324]|uniref:DeoR/GlpR family DNA-binding transcription regulator n=1 Tax=Tessaracoccus sp. OH4464_COT-324 TaxID=2491059 RepID=UPI000F638555|nr:DeoR/GlpR family DNA-binding transcription regulator [Tessaracoccus sp. OH4464_COT-324]RRD47491.1 DeoR/GlpR transcriptional regulator [Tessaracoccus sp. OH4464_COT-324]